MPISFHPLHPVFAAECRGVDIGQDLTPDQVAEIDAGMDRHAVLVFRRETPLSTEQQLAFTKNFGDLEPPYQQIHSPEGVRLAHPNLVDISNLGPTGTMLEREDRRRQYNLGNRLWHSDSSYKHIPARYSLLHAHVVPPEGGDTQFADMRAAWDMLDERMKALIGNLICLHSRVLSKGALGFAFTEQELEAFAPVRQRLVRTHPKTGRRSLFLSSHGARIEGWEIPEGMMLLRELTEHATQREFVYSHQWRAGDLVMWDNRATMHRATRYDDLTHERDMRRTTVTDGVPTIAREAAA